MAGPLWWWLHVYLDISHCPVETFPHYLLCLQESSWCLYLCICGLASKPLKYYQNSPYGKQPEKAGTTNYSADMVASALRVSPKHSQRTHLLGGTSWSTGFNKMRRQGRPSELLSTLLLLAKLSNSIEIGRQYKGYGIVLQKIRLLLSTQRRG